MARTFYPVFLLFICFSSFGWYRIAPTQLEGYTFLPNGPITNTEIKEYNPTLVKDLNHNGIVGLEFRGVSIAIKKKGETEYKFLRYVSSADNFINEMDTLVQDIAIDDSLYFSATYHRTTEYKGTSSAYLFQTVTSYALKTETIASLIRKGESLITIFPNPCINETLAKLDISEKLPATYYVLDGFGRKVAEGKLQDAREEIHINLRDEVSGTFVFYILIDTELFSKKVVKF